jgi:hypothetical protein
MPRYHFHLIDSIDISLDPEGVDLAADAVPRAALHQARDCMAGDVRNGQLNFNYRIEVHDEAGRVVHSLPFAHALEIVGEGSGVH